MAAFPPEGAPRENPFVLSIHTQKLADWVAIQSVSAWPEKRGEIRRMMEVAAGDIKQLGGSVELVDIGKQKVECSSWQGRAAVRRWPGGAERTLSSQTVGHPRSPAG